jgi:hypothetical protein
MQTQSQRPDSERPRAIFSTRDFRLLRVAVGEYAKTCKDPSEAANYANLLHRLGRVG